MSVKQCPHHGSNKKKLIKRILIGLGIFILVVGLIILITWAILKPKKPQFILQDATIYAFNVSAPILLSSNFQVTVSARNPNSKVGIYYDTLNVFATYHSQQITYFTVIQPVYQGHKDLNIWSPFVYGTNVPVAPYNGAALTQDQSNGALEIVIKINGRARWKVGSFISRRYHLHVTCQAYIPFGNKNSGIAGVVTGVKYQLDRKCSVSV